MSVQSVWERLEEWARSNAPEMLTTLNEPATEEEILAIEGKLKLQLPASFKESLRIHNGESDGWPCRIFADYGEYLPTPMILETWDSYHKISLELDEVVDALEIERLKADGIIQVVGFVRPVMFDDAWVPFAVCNGDIFWAIDLNPAEGGIPGQIIEVDWEGTSHKVIADSFDKFLESYVEELEAGTYPYFVEGIPTKNDPESEGSPAADLLKNEPYYDNLIALPEGTESEFIVSCMDNSDGLVGFKIHGGFVILQGKLITGHKSMRKLRGALYRIKAVHLGPSDSRRFNVKSYEFVASWDDI